MKNWYMAPTDDNGNVNGKRVCITDSVMETAGETEVSDGSAEQLQAADACVETEYGLKNGVQCGTAWTE